MAMKLFSGIAAAMNAAGTLLILILSVVINVDVVGRSAFAYPLNGVTEFAGLALVGIVFLQITDATAANKLTRSDTLLLALQRRRPRAAAFLEALYDLGGLALFLILARGAFSLAQRAWADDDYVGVAGIVTFPTWPVLTVICVASLMLSVVFARKILIALKAVFGRTRQAVVEAQEHLL